ERAPAPTRISRAEDPGSTRTRPENRDESGSAEDAPRVAEVRLNDGIRLTLGSPEPLPGLALLEPSPERLASVGSTSQWRPESTDRARNTASAPTVAADRLSRGDTVKRDVSPETPPALTVDSQDILSQAEARLDALSTYEVRLSRIERIRGQIQLEEDML